MIEKINFGNSIKNNNMKKVLRYAVKNRKGYYNQLCQIDERKGNVVDSLEMSGFIKTGHRHKARTFSITSLGDEYYKDLFGSIDYWKERLFGILERFYKKHV